jgi:PPK2 family polyphosphate:nucleotide phosphotransferase
MNLKSISTRAPKNFSKEKTKKKTEILKQTIGEQQNLMYAENKHSLLIILQGMDASGKDGVIKSVLETVNPIGCRVISFKKPTELEMKHDFLWRIHNQVPESGMLHVFNRSHYEDVLIQRVHKWVDEKTIKERFTHINNFEKLLSSQNTVVLKFFLYVSKEEQLARLNERMKDETKMWKYNQNDLKERVYWTQYMAAYEDAINKCSNIPWNIIPADQNWYRDFLISDRVASELKKLNMKYPGLKKQLD